LTFAGNEFALAERQSDGAPLRDHLETVARATRKTPAELAALTAVPCPYPLQHLWLAFLELTSTRPSNAMGVGEPLSFSEIESWARLTRRPLTAWQVDVIRRLDTIYLSQAAKSAKPKK
jgi:hypothetical protein